MSLVSVTDFQHPAGWSSRLAGEDRSRAYCEQLEAGQVLFFEHLPYELPEESRRFLLSLQRADSSLHKNVSYRPAQDRVRGFSSPQSAQVEELRRIMRGYSEAVTRFLSSFLSPYAGHWTLDFASFRPFEAAGRNLPLHKRDDLLHFDAFPNRPTHGGRILRVFTNINPGDPRVWMTGEPFSALAPRMALQAGLGRFAGQASSPLAAVADRSFRMLKRAVGIPAPERSAYDRFMLHFHDHLKEDSAFQETCSKTRLVFPPLSTWMVYTDTVPHAVLSGQYAMEQTYIVPSEAMVAPHHAPVRILERLCGAPLVHGGTRARLVPQYA